MSDMKEIKTIAGAVKSLGKFINETAMLSVNGSGRPVANQYVLNYERGQVFKSYRTLIAVRTNDGEVYLQKPQDTYGGDERGYSATTQTYLKQFLGGSVTKAVMNEKIAAGDYKVVRAI